MYVNTMKPGKVFSMFLGQEDGVKIKPIVPSFTKKRSQTTSAGVVSFILNSYDDNLTWYPMILPPSCVYTLPNRTQYFCAALNLVIA